MPRLGASTKLLRVHHILTYNVSVPQANKVARFCAGADRSEGSEQTPYSSVLHLTGFLCARNNNREHKTVYSRLMPLPDRRYHCGMTQDGWAWD